MVTRREMVTTGALGALAAGASEPGRAEGGAAQSSEALVAQALNAIAADVDQIRSLLRDSLAGPSLSGGVVGEIRRQFTTFLKSNQKFPDFCEIGPAVFTDLYDWHVRFQQPIEMSRVDNRTAIRFMFTWMILRPEQADGHIGIPFDRG